MCTPPTHLPNKPAAAAAAARLRQSPTQAGPLNGWHYKRNMPSLPPPTSPSPSPPSHHLPPACGHRVARMCVGTLHVRARLLPLAVSLTPCPATTRLLAGSLCPAPPRPTTQTSWWAAARLLGRTPTSRHHHPSPRLPPPPFVLCPLGAQPQQFGRRPTWLSPGLGPAGPASGPLWLLKLALPRDPRAESPRASLSSSLGRCGLRAFFSIVVQAAEHARWLGRGGPFLWPGRVVHTHTWHACVCPTTSYSRSLRAKRTGDARSGGGGGRYSQ